MSGHVSIQIDHNFETAHRLPFLGGKCTNLHGHSWKAKITFTAWQHETGMNDFGVSLEYGLLKKVVRGWIDEHLDHGAMLGVKDSLLPALLDQGSKVFVFGDTNWLDIPAEEEGRTSYKFAISDDRNYARMPWPTVEAVARMLAEKLQAAVDQAFNGILWIEAVNVMETATNFSLWIPSREGDDRFARFDERFYAQGDALQTQSIPRAEIDNVQTGEPCR